MRLLLGRALEVHPVDRRHRHVDSELDGVVSPRKRLGTLHLLGHLLEPPLEIRVVEETAEAFHASESTGAGESSPASSASQLATVRRRVMNAMTPGTIGSQNAKPRYASTAMSASAGSTPNAASAPIMPPSTPPMPPGSGSVLASVPTKYATTRTAIAGESPNASKHAQSTAMSKPHHISAPSSPALPVRACRRASRTPAPTGASVRRSRPSP